MHAIKKRIGRLSRALTLSVARPREAFASQRYTSARYQRARKAPAGRSLLERAKIVNLPTFQVWCPPVAGGDPASVLDDKVKEIGEEIKAKRQEAQTAWSEFDEHRKALAQSDADITDESSEGFQRAEEAHRKYAEAADELAALESRRERLWAMTSERSSATGPVERDVRAQIKEGLHSRESYGARVTASEAYKQLKDSGMLTSTGKLGNIRLGEMMDREEFAASLQASVIVTDEAGDSTVRPFIEPRHRGFVEPRYRPLLILDMITVGQTDSDSIDYVVETGYTNNAAFVPEAQIDGAVPDPDTENTAGVKPQSTLTFEKKDEAIKTLAHWVASTKKSLADVARLRSIIDNRLRRGLADVIEDQIIAGDGTGENLTGILNTPGIQHQELTAPLMESIHRAITKLRLAYFEPTAVGINPLDWEGIRLMRDDSGASAGTGGYLFGPPSQAGATTIWGLPPAIGPQFPESNPLVGDYRVAEFYVREGVQVLASDSHADFFVRNLVAILAEMRGGLIVPQPEGFCEVSEGS